MYKILVDDKYLYDPRDEELIVGDPRCKLEVNTVGEASFVIYPTHKHYGELQKMKSVFEIKQGEDIIFRGRMVHDSQNIDNSINVELEGAMAYLNDSQVMPFSFPFDVKDDPEYQAAEQSGNVIEFFLGWILEKHNSQVQDFQKLHLGNVTVSDPNNYIFRESTERTTTWETVKSKLFESSLGGYLCPRYEDDGTYIDYLEDFTEINPQPIKYGENLIDFKNESDISETYSAIIPLGYTQDNGERLDISNSIDGFFTDDIVVDGIMIYSVSAVEKIGFVLAPPELSVWDDVQGTATLRDKAIEQLEAEAAKFLDTIETRAVDLHYSDSEIASFRIYRKTRVVSEPNAIEETMPTAQLDIDILNPQNTNIIVGCSRRTLTGRNHAKIQAVIEKANKATVTAAQARLAANQAADSATEANQQANAAMQEATAALNVANSTQAIADAAVKSATDANKKAEDAAAAVEGVQTNVTALETTVQNAQLAADQAQQAAQIATQKATEAEGAAENAVQDAADAKLEANAAKEISVTAQERSEQAIITAGEAKDQAAIAVQKATDIQADAEQAMADIEAFENQLTTFTETLEADYTRKTEFTESTASLQVQITKNAADITETFKKITTVDETSQQATKEAKDAAEAAQQKADEATEQAQAAQDAATAAQQKADASTQAAQAAQAEADAAKLAAETAKGVADKAEEDLAAAKADLETVTGRVDATEADILEAQAKVTAAEQAAAKAKTDAETAVNTATQAQSKADTAAQSAANAQEAANTAAQEAAAAQAAAAQSESAAKDAQSKANKAASDAATAQQNAETAASNAQTAATQANQAAAKAQEAQELADAADAKAEQAKTDLLAAQENLTAVTNRVDATEEEVEAAKVAVQNAQKAADDADAAAKAAQSTANTAKADAKTAQDAADAAQEAADAADAEAKAAKAAADKAQEDVDNLAVTVTEQGTEIARNAEQIALRATKTEVIQTLGGYYTKEEANAAISVKADEITSAVSNIYTTKEDFYSLAIGGRNLLLNTKIDGAAIAVNGVVPSISGCTWENEGGVFTLNCSATEREIYYRFMPTTTGNMYTLEAGNDYTISGKMKVSSTSGTLQYVSVRSQHNNGTSWVGGLNAAVATEDSDEWISFEFTHSIPADAVSVYFSVQAYYEGSWVGTIQLKDLKIEKGNRATDWTPAPEDMATVTTVTALETRVTQTEGSIASQATEITSLGTRVSTVEQTASGLTTRVQNVEGDVSTLEQTASSLGTRLTNTEGDISALEQTASSLTSRIGDAEGNISTLQQTANGLTVKLDNMSIGGRNLIAGTSLDTVYSGNKGSGSYKDVWTGKTIDIPVGTEYVISFEAKADAATNIQCFFFSPNTTTSAKSSTGQSNTAADGACNVTLTTEWKRYWVKWTQTAANATKNIIVGRNATANNVYIRAVKLEEGNMPTAWTPAPEDVDSDISTAQTAANNAASAASAAQSTADSASTAASNAQSTANTANSTANAAKTAAATAQSTADTAKEDAATAQSTANSAATAASNAQSTANTARTEAANAAKTATNYLNFSNGGLVVGNMTASTLGNNVLIDTDSVDIRNGTTVLASFGASDIYLGNESTSATIHLCGDVGTIYAEDSSYDDWFDKTIISSGDLLIKSQFFDINASTQYLYPTQGFGNSSHASVTVTGSRGQDGNEIENGYASVGLRAAQEYAGTSASLSVFAGGGGNSNDSYISASVSNSATYLNIVLEPTGIWLSKKLDITGSSVNVKGALYAGSASIDGAFFVSGETILYDTLHVSGAANLNSTLTVAKQIYTSFRSSVAMGSYGASASTVPNLVEEVRYSSGCMGSANISTAYTNGDVTIPAGWYNFMYTPHRSGGANGAASGDNHQYGNLLLFGMTVANTNFRIRVNGGAISEVKRVMESKVLYNSSAGTTGTVTLSESAANFRMLEIIVGFSDTGACGTLKVYSPNGKTVDIDGLTVSASSWGASRVRYAISGKTMTASNNYKVTCSSAHALTYASNNLYCKQVIGHY